MGPWDPLGPDSSPPDCTFLEPELELVLELEPELELELEPELEPELELELEPELELELELELVDRDLVWAFWLFGVVWFLENLSAFFAGAIFLCWSCAGAGAGALVCCFVARA